MNLRPPGCECLDLADRMRYELEQVAPPLCKVHDVGAIAEREAARLRAVADAERARFGEIRTSLEPAASVCSCPDLVDSLHAALTGVEFDECAAHPEPASGSSSVPISDGTVVSILRGALGRDTTVNNNPGDWPPDAA